MCSYGSYVINIHALYSSKGRWGMPKRLGVGTLIVGTSLQELSKILQHGNELHQQRSDLPRSIKENACCKWTDITRRENRKTETTFTFWIK